MHRYASLLGFIAIVLGGGLIIGFATLPGEWYAGLRKPSFNPPNWIFGPVWSIIYVLIAIAGWRTWLANRDSISMKVWITQLVLNFLWSPVFFGAQQIGPALVIIGALLIAIAVFILLRRRSDVVAAWLFAPYLLWVMFATVLNWSIFMLN
jgi:benzodiazapine receptor